MRISTEDHRVEQAASQFMQHEFGGEVVLMGAAEASAPSLESGRANE